MECNRPTATATDDPLDVSDIKLQEISFDNSFSFDSDGSSDEFENSMSNTSIMSVGLPSSENIGYPIAAGAFTSTPKKGGYADVYEFSDDQNAGDSGIASISTVTSSLNNMSFDTSSESASDGENNLLHELPSGSSDSDTSTEHQKSMKAVERVEGIVKSQKCSTPAHLSKKLDNETVLINKKLIKPTWTIPHIAVSFNSCGQFPTSLYLSNPPGQFPTSLYLPTHVDNSPHHCIFQTHLDNSPHRCIFQLMWIIPHIAVSFNSCGQFPTSLYLPTHVDNSPHRCIFQLMWTIPHITVSFNSCGQFPTSLYLSTHVDNSPHRCIFQLMWTIPHIAVSSNSCGQFSTSLYLPTHVDNSPHRCIFQLMWTIPHIAVSSNSCGQFQLMWTILHITVSSNSCGHRCIFQLMWTIPHIAVSFNSCGQFPTSLYLPTHVDNSPHRCIFQLMWTIPHIAVSSNSCGQFPMS